MMPRLTSLYPEKLNLRVSVDDRINLIALAWFKDMEGKYGLSLRWFIKTYWPVFYASLSDEERAEFEKMRDMVIEHDQFESSLLPPLSSET
jgi:hypothetical protein